ncbi:MAG: tetratricopeptide repeat protein [Phycisphaeraceae bacterium]
MTTLHASDRSITFKTLLPAFIALVAIGGSLRAADDPALDKVRAALQAKQYDEAVKAADAYLKGTGKAMDEAIYLKATAHLSAGRFAEAVTATDALLSKHPKSTWYAKALFMKGTALARQRKFKEAEAIFEAEAIALLAPQRKREIAGVIVKFADALAVEPDAKDLSAPKPDYGKAYNLYGKVLGMEIDDTLREEVMFKRAMAIQKAGNHAQAVNDFHAYLNQFDPQWTGPVGSEPRLPQQVSTIPTGANRLEARYRLAKSQIETGNTIEARRNLEDLLAFVDRIAIRPVEGEVHPFVKLSADANWQIVRTYRMPDGVEDLDRAVKAAEDFLKAYPAHPHAIEAAWLIAQTYHRHGRYDQAFAAYTSFIEGKQFNLPQGEAASKSMKRLGKSAQQLKDEWTMLAVFQLGEIHFAQKKYTSAIAHWQNYIKLYPNGPQWADSQRNVISAEFMIALDSIVNKKHDDARKLFDAFLTAHPLDERAPQVLFILGQMSYAQTQEVETAVEKADINAAKIALGYRKAVDEWERLVSKYPGSEEASLALYRVGMIYEEKLGDLEKALESYRRLNWGPYAGYAQGRVAIMTKKQLTLATERTFRSSETPKIKLNVRNIEKLTVKQYYLDMEAYFRKVHATGGVESLDIALIQPDKQWEIKIDNYAKFKPIEQQIEIPFPQEKPGIGTPGVCIINISEDDLESTTLVVRSDLDLIMKASRREVLVYVQDMLGKKAAAGVEVLVSDGTKVIATGKTGEDGVYTQTLDDLKDCGDVRVFAKRGTNIASNMLSLSGLEISSGLSRKGYIFTDRPAYRPGQTVHIKGIIRDVKDGQYVVAKDAAYVLKISDPSGRLLRQEAITLSEFGSFDQSLPLYEATPLGAYTITAHLKGKPEIAYNGSFTVQQFQLEKMKLAMEFDRRVYFRGEKIKGTITAEYYWGQPVADRQVRYTLPDGRIHLGTTDRKGKVEFTFDTTPMTVGRSLSFQARIEGENIGVQDAVFLASVGFGASVSLDRDIVLAGEPFDVKVKTFAPDGKPTGAEMTLIVLRQDVRKADPVLNMVPWVEQEYRQIIGAYEEFDLNAALSNTSSGGAARRRLAIGPAEVTVSEHKVTTDPNTGEGIVNLKLEKGGQYILRLAGKDRFDQPVVAHGSVLVSDDEDATKLRLFSETDTLKVGQKVAIDLHSRLDGTLALITIEGETILSHRIVTLKKGRNPVQIDVAHAHYPNFSVAAAAMDGRDLRTASRPFNVQRQLNIAFKPAKSVAAPGEQAKFEITVTDQLGKPEKAELTLSLVDEALYALYGENVPPILSFFQEGAFRQAHFYAASTCGFQYRGATRSVIKEFLEEGERVAREGREMEELRMAQTELHRFGRPQVNPNFDAPNAPPSNAQWYMQQGQGQRAIQVQLAEVEQEEALWPGLMTNGTRRGERVGYITGPQRRSGNDGTTILAGLQLNDADPEAVARQDLPDAGHWLPSIITDDEGKATVTIPMPQNTTKWRLTARGSTIDTLVGDATAEIVTRKDFFVELKAPLTLREGDKPRLIARIHNLTDYEGDVKVRFVVRSGAKNYITFTPTVKVQKQGTTEFVFDVFTTPAVGELEFEVTAEAGEHRDALVKRAAVEPWGIEYADHGGGIATGDANVSVELPKGQKYSTKWLTLTVGPTLKQAILDMAMADAMPLPRRASMILPPRPIGAFAGSDLLAVVSALEYAKTTNAPPKSYEALADRARGLAAALVVSQHSSGGWVWQSFGDQNGSPDWLVSATSYWALVRANELGIAVHPDTLKKAATYLQITMTQVASTDSEARAVLVHALSTSKSVDFTHLNALHRERQQLSPIALAYTALAFANLDRNELAEEVLTVLEARAKTMTKDKRELAFWAGEGRYVWLNEEIETTAIALLAWVKARPTAPIAAKAADYLMNARGCFDFNPAKARGPAVAALAAFYGKAQQAGDDYTLTLLVNGKEVKQVARKGTEGTLLVDVPSDVLIDGPNMVTFQMKGQGKYAYAATLRGFSADMNDPKSFAYPFVTARSYRHAMLEYRGKPIGVYSTSPVRNLETGQRTQVLININTGNRSYNGYLMLEEHLPAGARLVEGSLSGKHRHVEVRDSSFVLYFAPGEISDVRYELVGYSGGDFRAQPTVIRDVMKPNLMRLGEAETLTVLPPNAKSPDPYVINDGERFALGRLFFEDGLYKEALEQLPPLFDREYRYNERDVARMLLWIHTSESFYDARRIVDTFEILRRRFPDLTIPFDKILVIGKAYRDIGEFERAMLVFRATIDNSFINDSNISAILQDEGQLLGSIDYQENLWRRYPDAPEVTSAYFALSQVLYQKAAEAHLLAKQQRKIAVEIPGVAKPQAANGHAAPTKTDMLRQSVAMLETFLTLYPEDPLADDAAFSLINVLLDLKAYDSVVKLSEVFRQRYAKSDFATNFQYMIALGHFWRRDYDPALAAAKVVADGESKDRDFARYILGQIYHAEGKAADAIKWYQTVDSIYADAKQAISYFEEKRIGLDEVNIFQPGKAVELKLKYRNIKEASLQVYRVDLMKLYLREKNLSKITEVNLAGISPQQVLSIELGDGKDYVEKEKSAKLDLKEEGAYLVICRGDDLFASGLVLITPLEIEVQEEVASGGVRANVIDKVKNIRPAEVHVKAIGSADSKFKSGETDLRGLFIADGLRGSATVIARAGDSRYAFYRGKTWLGTPEAAAGQGRQPAQPAAEQPDYQGNLRSKQFQIQQDNTMQFDKLRRQQNKGVEVQKAY